MTRNRRHPFGVLLNEMTAVGDEFAHLFGRLSGQPGQPEAATFPLNVWQDENAIYVEGDLPGVDRATLEVTVTEGDKLAIHAQRPAPEKVEGVTWLRRERASGRFSRVLALPFPVDSEKVEATYTNGVLKVTLPKSAAVKPRTIPVKVSE
ncbi:MAG: Hsp20/alpha crystallin family protein [Microbacterium sp.]|nr:Hsp20/alpha crystallin family protein [Microbacterium sp.]